MIFSAKNTILLSGAVAVGMQSMATRTTSPNLALFFVFSATVLAYLADPPRDPRKRDRADDNDKDSK